MTYLLRSELLQQMLDARRDLNKECGYPDTLTIQDFRQLYDRNPIAARVVEVLPEESWRSVPEVYEQEDVEAVTEFEQSWSELHKSLRGETSWYADSEGSPIWEALKRADKLAGIGHYGLIVLGLDDGRDLDQPVLGAELGKADSSGGEYVNNALQPMRLLYLTVLDESSVQSIEFESNRYSPRFRKPKVYSLNLGGMEQGGYTATGREQSITRVHWSRVVHVADNLTSSDIFGVPRMRPVLNRLMDLDKLYGGSAEMYWRGAFPGLSVETHPQLGGDVTLDEEQLKEAVWDYMNGLQRVLALRGMSAKSLAPQVVDPASQVQVQIEAICIKLGIPKRIFMGSERGELASSQDDSTWNDRLRDRQTGYLTPRVIIPFIDRLIQLGVLPVPLAGYRVAWPDPETLKPQEKADIAVKKTEALARYVGGSVETIIDPMDYLIRVLEFTEQEAVEILSNAESNVSLEGQSPIENLA